MRNRFCLLMTSIVLASAGLAKGDLISHFTFDGNTDNSVAGAPNGTAVGDPEFIAGYDGAPNGAISFASGVSQYVDTTSAGLPNATGGGIVVGSVANWIRTTSTGFVEIIGIANPTGGINDQGGFLWEGNRSANQLRIFIRSSNNQSTTMSVVTPDWRDGEWHHLAATWDFSGGAAAVGDIYLDGQPLGATISGFGLSAASVLTDWTTGVTVGARNNRGSIVESSVAFDLDDLRVYDHMLSASEVAALVPEPSAMVLMLLASVAFAFAAHRRRTPVHLIANK